MTQEEYDYIIDTRRMISYFRSWINIGIELTFSETLCKNYIWSMKSPFKEDVVKVINDANATLQAMFESKLAELEKEFADIVIGVKFETKEQ